MENKRNGQETVTKKGVADLLLKWERKELIIVLKVCQLLSWIVERLSIILVVI